MRAGVASGYSKRPQDRTPIGIEAVFDGVPAKLRPAIEEAGAEVTSGPSLVVTADRLQLLQLFRNLVVNAIKYRHPKRSLKIQIVAEERSSDYVFRISDNGTGIEQRYRERIFARYRASTVE